MYKYFKDEKDARNFRGEHPEIYAEMKLREQAHIHQMELEKLKLSASHKDIKPKKRLWNKFRKKH